MLAGGKSTRYGKDKLTVILRGRPMLHHPIAALSMLCEEILVVTGADGPERKLPFDVLAPCRLVHDDRPDGGPLVGLAAGLRESNTPISIVAAGDMPEMSQAVLRLMLTSVRDNEDVDALVMQDVDTFRPLPAVVRTRTGEVAEKLIADGKDSLNEFFGAVASRTLPENEWRPIDPRGATLWDVDTPNQLP
ncbi:MAG: molybdenum cofactor guanylyltransferase [Actinomycetota bacterium]